MEVPTELKQCDFFHGILPRIESETSLLYPGDYLLRLAETPNGCYVVLSVRCANNVANFQLSFDDGKYYFESSTKESTIMELINNYKNKKQPITEQSKAQLIRSIRKPVWLVAHEKIAIVKRLGAGAYGEVFLAQMDDPTAPARLECAVKSMRQEATAEARLRFLKEARMMRKSYHHKNVVMIFGIAISSNPLLILMELCPNGSLLSHLRKNKGNISANEKLRFSMESSDGLHYLEKLGCIHRDIAARNCLLSSKNQVKISDFGLAHDNPLIVDDTLGKIPIKWLAPETMQEKIYSIKSDIWAFGVMLWEIYSDGDEPYPGLTPVQTRAKIVVQDYRMKMPEITPQPVVEIVDMCWNKNPDKRGTMLSHYTNIKLLFNAEKVKNAIAMQ